MKILGIESSCDDTSVALVDITDAPTPLNPPSGRGEIITILAEMTASQIEIHKKYGGVVPEIAGRMHAEKILPVIEEVMKDQDKPDVIAVTSGPGLITGLLVGVEAAKTLSMLWDVPLIGVNHIEGHIYSPLIPMSPPRDDEESFEVSNNQKTKNRSKSTKSGSERSLVVPPRDEPSYPLLALVASGGHSEIILSKKEGYYEKIGGTRDDAAGECFDKVAKLLGFDYPGGPKISKFAEDGDPNAINFPRPMLNNFSAKGGPTSGWDFSFSGLKTSALYWLRDHNLVILSESERRVERSHSSAHKQGDLSTTASLRSTSAQDDVTIHDFCASFEQAIVDLLVSKTMKAVKKYQPKTVILGGGVSANKKLRETLGNEIKENFPASTYLIPNPKYAMDNAAMIAVAAYNHAKKKEFINWKDLKAEPNWKIYTTNINTNQH